MIQIESVRILETRGIRDLTLTPNRTSVVIVGPNGSGKSGVVDAVQFALTGEITRLTGTGTGDLSLAKHGPHVLKKDYPDAAVVELTVFIPHLGKTATIARRVKKPKQPTITPDDADVVQVLREVSEHPELILSRREIIKFIITDPGKRSREVQSLLKLDDIDVARATLRTVETKLTTAEAAAKGQFKAAEESLKRHFDLPSLRDEDLLSAINAARKLLGGTALHDLTSVTSLVEGVTIPPTPAAGQDKESALRDLDALVQILDGGLKVVAPEALATVHSSVDRLETEPELLANIKATAFVETGLDLVIGPYCPLCETAWDISELRGHLAQRLAKLREAQKFRSATLAAGSVIAGELLKMVTVVKAVMRLPEASSTADASAQWVGRLEAVRQQLGSIEGIMAADAELGDGVPMLPAGLKDTVTSIRVAVMARPDTSDITKARDFLVVAQERWNLFLSARRDVREKELAAARGREAYKTYCDVAEAALTKLYEEVEGDFAKFYRMLNPDNEGKFVAKLEPAEGSLGLTVDFHEIGMFPPSAYHSEGHQDGMGVCLYLALMRRVLGSRFSVAVLDDVVMSVDSEHRKQFCRLLKTEFPNTQFIVTTHDQVWARQMRSEGVVSTKGITEFIGWSVDVGPIVEEGIEVWTRIEDDLTRNDVPSAAGRLRRHIELVAGDLADKLGAEVQFKADGSYDKGELLGAVLGRQRDLLGLAAKAANSWKNAQEAERVKQLQERRSQILAACNGEDWVINKAVHYNEMYQLSRQDFAPVVAAFRQLLDLFRCPTCNTTAAVSPRSRPISLRCDCGGIQFNLKAK